MSDRGEPRSWDPTTPGICALWFDATTITGVANGATITSWVPRTGIYTLTGTATYEAGAGLAVAGGGGPFPGVYFGGSDALQASGADYAQPYTIAVVASSMPASGTNFSTFCDSRSGGPDSGGCIAAYISPGQYAAQAGLWELSGVAVDSIGQQRLIIAVFNGTSSALYVDNYKVPGLGSLGPKTLHFGQLGRDWFGDHLTGYICEYTLHNGALTDTDAANYFAYAHTKWGVPGLGTSSAPLGPLTVTAGPGGGVPPATLPLGPLVITATSSSAPPTVTGTATLNIGPLVVAVDSNLETRTGTIALPLGPLLVAIVAGRTGPGAFPVPGYRGRWRLTLHNRQFAPATLNSTMIAELADAYGRRLDQTWNQPAQLTFTLDGHAQSAALVQELLHDVVAWRWDDQTGTELAVFRGVISHAEDQISEQAHTVTYVCHDYAALLTRRLITGAPYTAAARDQDLIVGDLLGLASSAHDSGAISLLPASYLPLGLYPARPDGSLRGLSGQLRDRTYYPSQNIGTAVDDLAKVIGGFDYDVQPSAVDAVDRLRVFYPQQGVTRSDGMALQYGSTVATLTRTVDSAAYANFVRVLGNNQSTNPMPQIFSEGRTTDANSTTAGLWMLADDATNVTDNNTLLEKARGDLNLYAVLVPSYTLGLAAGAYTWGNPNMGDTVPLLVQSGRLNVNTSVRVLGISYMIGDDGQEDITLTVSRPAAQLYDLFAQANRDVRDLALR